MAKKERKHAAGSRDFKVESMTSFPISRPERYQVIYSNNTRMTYSPQDIRITFMQFTDDVGYNKYINTEEATVFLSPLAAKLMLIQLAASVKALESAAGEIKIPDGMITQTP